MAADDTPDADDGENGALEPENGGVDAGLDGSGGDVRERLEQEADRALEQFDDRLIDLLSWMLETETRARIYVHLRQHPDSTSDEIAEGTGLYPSTVREALAALHEDGTVTRSKRQNSGAGNNPYEYGAIPPSDLVGGLVDEVQNQLNTVVNLDEYLETAEEGETEPVTITVTDERDERDESDTGDASSDESTGEPGGGDDPDETDSE